MKKKQRRRFKGQFKWNEYKQAEGGMGHALGDRAKFHGIKVERDSSPYIGMVGMIFHINNKKEAKIVADVINSDLDFVYSGIQGHGHSLWG